MEKVHLAWFIATRWTDSPSGRYCMTLSKRIVGNKHTARLFLDVFLLWLEALLMYRTGSQW